jgi:hypothetical protein
MAHRPSRLDSAVWNMFWLIVCGIELVAILILLSNKPPTP